MKGFDENGRWANDCARSTRAIGVNPSDRRLWLERGALLAGGAWLAGCSSPSLGTQASSTPGFDLRGYFDGPIKAHGLFVDRTGDVKRRFVVAMQGTWRGSDGVLDEDFVYDDGEKQKRVWRLRDVGQGRFEGRADDVQGVAIGESAGSAFRWRYTLLIDYQGRKVEVQFDDWMHRIDDKVVLNRAEMSKFGIRLGDVQLAFLKP